MPVSTHSNSSKKETPGMQIVEIEMGDKNAELKIKDLNDKIKSPNNHIFLFLFMVGCGPCNMTKESWAKIQKHVKKHHLENPEIIIARVDKDFYPQLSGVGPEPMGFPTLRHVHGSQVQSYEDNKSIKVDRSPESFAQWIENAVKHDALKVHASHVGGTRNYSTSKKCRCKTRLRRRAGGSSSKMKGGKWSLKYKRSIDCNHPKGFSQRQHCKYGRKKNNKTRKNKHRQ